ncbi:MAG: tRNA lysidine(34) synthetase TilS [Arsenophonus sp.]|nr:MAG: tRNA lysidine(34) synthetase TilS [Arsenophonus sp.]
MHHDDCLLINKIDKILKNYKNILVSFSGGLDSTVLLHVLMILCKKKNTKYNIRALHVNHNISNKSDLWMIHCQKICLKWNIPFFVKKIFIQSLDKGLEDAARKKRYQSILETLLPNEIVVTGQHLDDQAETFFLALKRGSGPKGLSSMSIISPFFFTFLIRPLLTFNRISLKKYAIRQKLFWIEDDTNQDEKYERNFLRSKIFSVLNKRWPYFSQSIFKSSKMCAEQEKLLDELLYTDFIRTITQEGSLLVEKLIVYSKIKRNAILRKWFRFYNLLMPSQIQLEKIFQNVICAKINSDPIFHISHIYEIRRFKKQLWILKRFKNLANIVLEWNINKSLILPDQIGIITTSNSGFSFRTPLYTEKVTVRFGLKGFIKIMNSKKLISSKKIWKKFNIYPWLRDRIPLLYYNEILIGGIGLFITESGKCIDKKSKLTLNFIKN